MAQYLLLEFDDNASCARLITKVQEATAKGRKFRIVGLFQKPTRFCECGPLTDLQQTRETARGSRFGWWIHIPCNRTFGRLQSPQNLWPTSWRLHLAPNDMIPLPNHPIEEVPK